MGGNAPLSRRCGGGPLTLTVKGMASSRMTLARSRSDHSAVGAQDLAVDPAAVRADEEGDGGSDVLGRAEPLERIELRHAIDEVLRLAVEEQVGGRRSGSNGVDRDRAAAQLLRQDRRQGLYRRLRRCVDAIGFEPQADDAGREVHDAAAVAKPARGLAKAVE